ncbi:hypothetical protein OIDMADRAFT_185611 [Oidiodendron maius Zn]|uniref:FAD dependent oxidoreductase domain-containing protein n=1 Tax=Oidiodendron maius (strain Zn) TaxID=913774 RepID=A0A0C3HG88_OIDMZ|nr:hypothetical protein OIDMADRAFT_185611 [Oidiodendron maius Zn]
MAHSTKEIIVLGAGVTGLQTALSLLTSHAGYKVTLVATHFPGDISINYTSPLAGGHWRSHAGLSAADALLRAWDARTYEVWLRLLREGDGKAGEGYEDRYQSVCINVPQYLVYLYTRVTELGARIIKSTVDVSSGLDGAVRDAKRIVLSSDPSLDKSFIFALINATGLSARHILEPEEAAKLYPIRGQTILVKGEANRARTYTDFGAGEEIAYVIPRAGSGTTIIGGCKQTGNYDQGVDEKLNDRIIERVVQEGMARELQTGKDGRFEIISYQVGWRPARKGGPRVELEKKSSGKFDGTWLVHAYGHSGGGYQESVGSAERVVEILKEL